MVAVAVAVMQLHRHRIHPVMIGKIMTLVMTDGKQLILYIVFFRFWILDDLSQLHHLPCRNRGNFRCRTIVVLRWQICRGGFGGEFASNRLKSQLS